MESNIFYLVIYSEDADHQDVWENMDLEFM